MDAYEQICAYHQPSELFSEYSAVIGTGRHFVGLHRHMLLPVVLLIRGRTTHFGTHSKLRPVQVISIPLLCLGDQAAQKSCALVEADRGK